MELAGFTSTVENCLYIATATAAASHSADLKYFQVESLTPELFLHLGFVLLVYLFFFGGVQLLGEHSVQDGCFFSGSIIIYAHQLFSKRYALLATLMPHVEPIHRRGVMVASLLERLHEAAGVAYIALRVTEPVC